MLQAIHQKAAAPRASSVYCRWIRNGREKGAPLVAVWIDSQMGCFEAEFAADPDTVTHDSVDEPGGAMCLQPQRRTGIGNFTTYS
jgi:hypothetical protein